MAKRLTRLSIGVGTLTVVLFALAGTWRDPWLWAYVSLWALASTYAC